MLPQSRGVAAKIACIVVVLGIVATIIAGACVAPCPAIQVICAACIGGFAALGTGTMSFVVACFKL